MLREERSELFFPLVFRFCPGGEVSSLMETPFPSISQSDFEFHPLIASPTSVTMPLTLPSDIDPEGQADILCHQ